MSSSPSSESGLVVPASVAATMKVARYDVDLRTGVPVPAEFLLEARTAAHAMGYADGWAAGQRGAGAQARENAARARDERKRAAAERTATLEQVLRTVGSAAAELERRALPVVTEIEEQILRAAVQLAETLVGRELELSREPGVDAIRRVLGLAPVNRPLTVRLCPADHAALVEGTSGSDRYEIDGRSVTLLPDPALRSGDAVGDSDATTIDARIGPAMERVRAVVGIDPAAGPPGDRGVA